jgi:hypothetical protein
MADLRPDENKAERLSQRPITDCEDHRLTVFGKGLAPTLVASPARPGTKSRPDDRAAKLLPFVGK